MDYEKLVEQVLNEVYCRLNQVDKAGDKMNFSADKKTAVILFGNEKSQYDLLKEEFNIACYEEKVRRFEVVIVEKLCLRGLTTLAMGTNVSPEERFILTSLLKGKKVYILESGIEYKKYKTTAPKNLYRQYIEYEERIKGHGITIISHLSEVLESKEYDLQTKQINLVDDRLREDKKAAADLTNKKLISESDLNRLYMQGKRSILVDKGTIITPLAYDFIRTHHLEIK